MIDRDFEFKYKCGCSYLIKQSSISNAIYLDSVGFRFCPKHEELVLGSFEKEKQEASQDIVNHEKSRRELQAIFNRANEALGGLER